MNPISNDTGGPRAQCFVSLDNILLGKPFKAFVEAQKPSWALPQKLHVEFLVRSLGPWGWSFMASVNDHVHVLTPSAY